MIVYKNWRKSSTNMCPKGLAEVQIINAVAVSSTNHELHSDPFCFQTGFHNYGNIQLMFHAHPAVLLQAIFQLVSSSNSISSHAKWTILV